MPPRVSSVYEQLDGFVQVEACYSWTWNDFHMTAHRHSRAEIMYLRRGKCRVTVFDGDREREFRLNVGEFIFIDADVLHMLHVDESCYMVNVEFSVSDCLGLLTLRTLMERSAAFHGWLHKQAPYQCGKDTDGALYGVLSAVVDDFGHQDTVDHALQELRLAQMLVVTANLLMTSAANASSLVHVRRCVRLLSERLSDDVRIGDIAAELGLSAAYLQRIFHQVQGVTMVEYLNRLRVEQAKLLLMNTNDSVLDIAMASGFNSRQHFSRVFTALEGCSPLHFRQNIRRTETKQVFLFE